MVERDGDADDEPCVATLYLFESYIVVEQSAFGVARRTIYC